ncbi:MAG: endonuclease/exonuclease/phosphatase family protein, partial [Lentimicrobiaceae bacterium]|nr:endonuclease/exonuclease/phosphatase family protein [Lentimicrobiaceae bacterium]
ICENLKHETMIKSKFFLQIFLWPALLLWSVFMYAEESDSINLMTWNIRLDVASDGIHQWKYREQPLTSFILKVQPDVLGIQEALDHQVNQINSRLKGYAALGVGRDDGAQKGEYNALYYKVKNIREVRSGTFWLSEMPEVAGSKGWDAACNRIATWAEFEHLKSGKHFLVMNTHFDHVGDTARVNSAKLIVLKLEELAKALPAVLMGDFNVDDTHEVYRILTDPKNEIALSDSRKSKDCEVLGPNVSFVDFNPEYQPSLPIDFIFASPTLKAGRSIIYDFRGKGNYLSDHLPVIVEMALPD